MDWNVLDEYLVRIGADIDRNSFNTAKGALEEIKRHLAGLKNAAAPLALAAAIGAVGKAAYETVKSVAQADMEYKKLAASMWVTKETAKSLSVAMKTMGVSQEDLAWVPELREQFFRLREEMNRFATPGDADEQLRYIREIGYDIQALFVRLKMLKEWIAYYLIKYLEPYIADFKAFIGWLLDKVGTDLPGLARKVAGAMAAVLRPALATLKALGLAIGHIYDFIEKLPGEVKAWVAVFAAVGAAIMAGPFGGILMALSAAMILIEDFMGYMNGWDSSETLAPVWEALLKFVNGEGSEWMNRFTKFLSETARLLGNIVKLTLELDKAFFGSIPDIEEFGQVLLDAIKFPFEQMKMLSDLFVTILEAINLLLEGKKTEAFEALVNGVKNIETPGDKIRERMKDKNAKGFKWMSPFGYGIDGVWDKAKEFFGFGSDSGSGEGSDVVKNASQFGRGYQWMDPTGANTDPRNQCASFASQMMASAGVPVDVTMNGNDLASQFKAEGAYHRPGDGYVPQPGDLIDWAHHVGIYAGNGQYIARNSSGGVQSGSMQGMEKHFGELWGFGSVSELAGAKNQDTSDGISGDMVAMSPEPSYGSDVAGFMEGSNQMASVPGMSSVFGGFGGGGSASSTFNMGNPVININVAGTNATAEEIAGAVKDGLTGLGDYMLNIQARQMRRATV